MADLLERLISLVARDLLAEHDRVLDHDALIEAIAVKGAGTVLDEVPREVIEDIVSAEGNGDGPLVELGDGRVVDAIDRFDGATLPHRLTAAERDADALAVHPDLSVLADLTSADGGLHLADGTPLRLVRRRRTPTGAPRSTSLDHELQGPTGWLEDLPLGPIGITVDDGFVRLAASQPATGSEADRALAIAADGARAAAGATHAGEEHDGMPRSIDLLQCAGIVDGWWLPTAAGPTFEEVLAAAGLERRGDLAGAPGCWERWDELNVVVGRLSRHRYFEDDGLSALLAAHKAWEAWRSDPAQQPPVRVCRTLHLHTDLPAALLAELRRDDPEGDEIDGFLAALPTAGGPAASGPLTLRAAWALARDQPELAAELAAAAVAADPQHHAAVDLLAELAADRGDLARAVALLRTVRTDDDPELVLQQRRVQSLDPQVGRNEPCPCGSGRKYKQCHLGRMELPTADLVALAVEGIRDHLVRTLPPGAVDGLLIDIEVPEGAGEGAVAVATDALIFDDGGLDRYLEARRTILPPDRVALLERWAAEHRPGLYRVQGLDAGHDLVLVDHRRGDEVRVGRSASFDVVTEGQLVWCRLLPAGDRWWTAGIVRPVADHEIEAVAAREDATDSTGRVRALLAPDLAVGTGIRRAADGQPWVWCHSMITHDLEAEPLLAALDAVLPRTEGAGGEDDDAVDAAPASTEASVARWRILEGDAEVGRVTTVGDAVVVAAESIGPFDRTLPAVTEALRAAGAELRVVSERRLPDARDEVLTADEELLAQMFEDL